MALYDIPIHTLQGADTTLGDYAGKTVLVVNVASKCGLTPQYEGLERLQKKYEDRGFSVVGFPCNQFLGQEPGTAEEIESFCSTTYGVTFPMYEKIDVNGQGRHPLYGELTQVPDAAGEAGDIQWNFEKFLVSPDGEVVNRFRPTTEPESGQVEVQLELAVALERVDGDLAVAAGQGPPGLAEETVDEPLHAVERGERNVTGGHDGNLRWGDDETPPPYPSTFI